MSEWPSFVVVIIALIVTAPGTKAFLVPTRPTYQASRSTPTFTGPTNVHGERPLVPYRRTGFSDNRRRSPFTTGATMSVSVYSWSDAFTETVNVPLVGPNLLAALTDADASATSATSSLDAPTVFALNDSTTILVFVIGLVPFAVATVEFWRRIAVGESFGTGSDSVVFSIGEDDAPASSRGRRVLGKDALAAAYILFAVAALVLGVVLAAVLTTPNELPLDFAASATAATTQTAVESTEVSTM